ncbi:MAG TPA: TIGR00730 family Rossman fold protein [Acidobacteriaceae bacterium]|nr:TIGR00730 family Rossman fold protein [Acidobacteriaceae bacterium]
MSSAKKWVCVFCASTAGASPEYLNAAQTLGGLIARRGYGLLYGGAIVGAMGAVADGALAAGGDVVGVIPEVIKEREIEHRGLTELHVVRTMHERKALLAERADAFVALPGGYGTMDEFIEIVTWAKLRIHAKPCVLVNLRGYFDGLLRFLDRAVAEGFIEAKDRGLAQVASDPESALDLVQRVWRARAEIPEHDPRLDAVVR